MGPCHSQGKIVKVVPPAVSKMPLSNQLGVKKCSGDNCRLVDPWFKGGIMMTWLVTLKIFISVWVYGFNAVRFLSAFHVLGLLYGALDSIHACLLYVCCILWAL